MFKFFLGVVFFLIFPFVSHAQIKGNINIEPQGDSLGYTCDVDWGCGNGDHEVEVNTNFVHYSAWKECESEDPEVCTLKKPLTLKIKLGSTWYNASSSSPISIVSGTNPQNVYGQEDDCDPTVNPRATWTLKAKTTTACQTYEMYVENWQSHQQDFFTVSVLGDCQEEYDYTNTLLLICWILAIVLSLLISGLFKYKKCGKI